MPKNIVADVVKYLTKELGKLLGRPRNIMKIEPIAILLTERLRDFAEEFLRRAVSVQVSFWSLFAIICEE